MPIVYRSACAQDLERADALVVASINALTERHGFGSIAATHPTNFQAFSLKDDARGLWVAEEAGVTVETAVEGSFTVRGNRELIGQALSNIVDNAIKYSLYAVGGKPAVRVGLRREAGEIRLTVADNGQGIPDHADRARATERFVRLEKSRSQPGSGLGLSLAKAVMKFHEGRLDLLPGDPGLSVVMSFPERADR